MRRPYQIHQRDSCYGEHVTHRSLPRSSFGALALSLAMSAAAIVACGGDDSGSSAGTAGSGVGGTSGSAGTGAPGGAGTSGNAGKGGAGADGTGGTGGGASGASAGKGGGAGTSGGAGTGGGAAGKSGNAGNAGTGGAGASGAGGAAGKAGTGGAAGSAAGSAGASGSAGAGGCGLGVTTSAPLTLSATGLYSDIKNGVIAKEAIGYVPRFTLWSDDADKKRWLYVPPCTQIDTSDMDYWQFPVGTRVWKEFDVGGVRVETRLVHRYGPGPNDFVYAAYLWRADQSDADYVEDGMKNVFGTQHDVPSALDCGKCHAKARERVLGISAIQLGATGPLTLAQLSSMGLLSKAPTFTQWDPPGDAATQKTLGYLHSNCGNCHNTDDVKPLHLRLSLSETTVKGTEIYQTSVGVMGEWMHPGINAIVVPGDPASSSLYYRMTVRGDMDQMPPLASEITDPAGIDLVGTWIKGL
jgi:hypothetical protein